MLKRARFQLLSTFLPGEELLPSGKILQHLQGTGTEEAARGRLWCFAASHRFGGGGGKIEEDDFGLPLWRGSKWRTFQERWGKGLPLGLWEAGKRGFEASHQLELIQYHARVLSLSVGVRTQTTALKRQQPGSWSSKAVLGRAAPPPAAS